MGYSAHLWAHQECTRPIASALAHSNWHGLRSSLQKQEQKFIKIEKRVEISKMWIDSGKMVRYVPVSSFRSISESAVRHVAQGKEMEKM